MKYWQMLILIVVSGFVGGIISAVVEFLGAGKTIGKDSKGIEDKEPKDIEGEYDATNGISGWLFFAGRGVIGVGGAFAILLAIIVAGRYKDEINTTNLLFMTSAC